MQELKRIHEKIAPSGYFAKNANRSLNIAPPLMPEIETTSYEGKALIVIRVAHWRVPFYLKSQGPEKGTYVRLGSTNRVAGPELTAELKRSISQKTFDQLPCPHVPASGLVPC